MKIKTAELEGDALDWVIAKIEGRIEDESDPTIPVAGREWDGEGLEWPVEYSPSTDWAQGGPILESENITVERWNDEHEWRAMQAGESTQYGETYLVAAMRCFVASKLGDEVEVPDGLVDGEQASLREKGN